MNQDQVKDILLQVAESPAPFDLFFSGKASKKVNGFYRPASAEIVLHNQNFDNDSQLLYTALHEYAHHICYHRGGCIPKARNHSSEFWAIFHELVQTAEEKGFYKNIFTTEPEFIDLTNEIKEKCFKLNGDVLLEFGRLLTKAFHLCHQYKTRYEDFLERVIGVPAKTAKGAVASNSMGLSPSLGWDNMLYVAKIKDPDERSRVIDSLSNGASTTSVKGLRKIEAEPEDLADRLLKEKSRIESTIRSLSGRLEEIEEKLSEL